MKKQNRQRIVHQPFKKWLCPFFPPRESRKKMRYDDACRASRRGGIQNVPIVSVGASDPLLIPRSAKHRPDPLVPTPSPLSRSRPLSLSLARFLLPYLSPFLFLFLSLAAGSLSPLHHPLVSSCSTTLCAPTHPLPSRSLTRLRAIYHPLAAVSHASEPDTGFTL